MVGGLRGAALVVQGGATGRVVFAQGQPGIAGDVARLFAGLGHTAAGDVFDVAVIQSGALDDFFQRERQQFCGVKIAEIAHAGFAAGDGCANGFDDNSFRHDDSS